MQVDSGERQGGHRGGPAPVRESVKERADGTSEASIVRGDGSSFVGDDTLVLWKRDGWGGLGGKGEVSGGSTSE